MTDKLPTLESATTSDMVRVNLDALHGARKSFREAEGSEEIQSNVRIYADEYFVTGDKVYYEDQIRKGGIVQSK